MSRCELVRVFPIGPPDLHGMPDAFEPDKLEGVPAPLQYGDTLLMACLVEKCASTRIKALLCRAAGLDLADCLKPHQVAFPNVLPTRREVEEFITRGGRHFSFVLVRNPYLRLLSAYLDKYADYGKTRRSAFLGEAADTFPEFVDLMYRHWSNNSTYGKRLGSRNFVLPHFTPITDHCGIRDGFRFDHHFKVEQMPCWLLPFLKAVGGDMAALAATGWEAADGGKLIGNATCFYSPPGVACEEFYAGGAHPRECSCSLRSLTETPGGSTHAHGSAALLHTHYTPRAAVQVGNMFRADLVYFDYPSWDGVSEFRPC